MSSKFNNNICNVRYTDIDECALNIHECTEAEECVNEEGGYFCNDPNFELESDLNTDLLDVRCPSGYKHNYTTKVCDGKRIKKILIPIKRNFPQTLMNASLI